MVVLDTIDITVTPRKPLKWATISPHIGRVNDQLIPFPLVRLDSFPLIIPRGAMLLSAWDMDTSGETGIVILHRRLRSWNALMAPSGIAVIDELYPHTDFWSALDLHMAGADIQALSEWLAEEPAPSCA